MLQELINFVSTNQVFSGLMGAASVGTAAYLFRQIPHFAKDFIRWFFSVEVLIFNTDAFFSLFTEWLSEHEHAKKVRSVRVSNIPTDNEDSDTTRWRLTPGTGWHWFKHDNRWYWYEYSIDSTNSRGSFTRETILLRTWGRDQSSIRKILCLANDLQSRKRGVEVWTFSMGYWKKIGYKAARNMSSITCEAGVVEKVLSDARWFFSSAKWYSERGIPHRRGYLLHGEPGTGKTSLAHALASELKVPLYVLPVGVCKSDEDISSAFAEVSPGSILLIEDIDVARASHIRVSKNTDADEDEKVSSGRITLSGLLNAIDGVATSDSRLLIMTTNFPDTLDSALIRPGRVDLKIKLSRVSEQLGLNMIHKIDDTVNVGDLGLMWPATPAEIQVALLDRMVD